MPTRGTAIKTATENRLSLLRPMVTRRYELSVDHELCCGCHTCETICPREAITLSEAVVVDGRVVESSRVDIDETTCSFCGECVVLCPTHALQMTINDKPEIPVIRAQAFPMLIRRISVNQEPLQGSTDVAYIETCPVGAISADIEYDNEGQVVAVSNVNVDRSTCINCTHCMETGPEGGFVVTKPYRGRTRLNARLCPEGCQACVDVCPTSALAYDGERVALDERFCIYCGACQHVCPVEGAIVTMRSGFVHLPVESGAWAAALEKLVSFAEVSREYDIKAQRKRRRLIVQSLIPEMNMDQEV